MTMRETRITSLMGPRVRSALALPLVNKRKEEAGDGGDSIRGIFIIITRAKGGAATAEREEKVRRREGREGKK